MIAYPKGNTAWSDAFDNAKASSSRGDSVDDDTGGRQWIQRTHQIKILDEDEILKLERDLEAPREGDPNRVSSSSTKENGEGDNKKDVGKQSKRDLARKMQRPSATRDSTLVVSKISGGCQRPSFRQREERTERSDFWW